VELYLHSPNTPSWRGVQLQKSTGTTLSLPLQVSTSPPKSCFRSLIQKRLRTTCLDISVVLEVCVEEFCLDVAHSLGNKGTNKNKYMCIGSSGG